MDDRSVTIKVGRGENERECALLLTTRATMEIAKKYGGLDKMGETMMRSDDMEDAMAEVCWLIALLANQSIQIHNIWNPQECKPLLTAEMLEYMTAPNDLVELQTAVMDAINNGMRRNVISEDDEKNVEGE